VLIAGTPARSSIWRREESIGATHDAVDARDGSKKRARQKIIVAGCLSQRFAQELPTLMPDVDAFIGLDQITQVAPIIPEDVWADAGDGSVETSSPRSRTIRSRTTTHRASV